MQIGPKSDGSEVEETFTVTRQHEYREYSDKWVTVEKWHDEDGNLHNTGGPAYRMFEHDGNVDRPTKFHRESWYIRGQKVGDIFHEEHEQGRMIPDGFALQGLNPFEPS